MASIYRNGAGTWTVQWTVGRDRTGRKVRDSRTFESRQAAIAHKHVVEQAATGTGRDSLEARALAWIEDRRKLGKIGEKTAVGYTEKIRAWARLIGPMPFKKITAAELDRAFARLDAGETPTGRKPSARTLHHYRTVLATFFNHMEGKDEIARNPMRGVEGVGGLKQRTRRAPTPDELQRILAAAAEMPTAIYGQLQTIIRIAAHLGLRRGELCALRWQDVDVDRMTVTVARAATQPLREVYFKAPKSEAGFRTITMLEPTAAIFREQKRRVSEWRLAAGSAWADNDLVFPDPLGQVLNMEQLSRDAGIARDKAKVPAAVLPLHGQRHYALTSLHKAGVDLLTMQARAGHGDVRSTQGYITVDLDKDREAAAKASASLI